MRRGRGKAEKRFSVFLAPRKTEKKKAEEPKAARRGRGKAKKTFFRFSGTQKNGKTKKQTKCFFVFPFFCLGGCAKRKGEGGETFFRFSGTQKNGKTKKQRSRKLCVEEGSGRKNVFPFFRHPEKRKNKKTEEPKSCA